MLHREKVYINVVKGILIFLMLWGHCIQYCAQDSFDFFENVVFKVIYSFHMPLFMLVSGYLFFYSFRKRELKELLVHRTQSMLQPIVFASMLNCLLMKLPTLVIYGQFKVLDGQLLNYLYSLWFLWCVLSSSTAVAIACKVTDNPWLQALNVVLGIFLVALFPDVNMHLFMYPYFVIGFFCGKYKERLAGLAKIAGWLSLPAFPVLMLFFEKKHYIYVTPIFASGISWKDRLLIAGFRWAIGLVGCVFVLVCIKALFDAVVKTERIPKAAAAIAKLGENSLSIYCLSVSLLSWYLPKIYTRIVQVLGGNLFAENMAVFNFVFTPLLTAAYCFGLYGVILLMKRTKLHAIIFGR